MFTNDESYINNKPNKVYKYKWKYENLNDETKSILYEDDGSVCYLFDKEGKLTEKTKYDCEHNIIENVRNFYDENGNNIRTILGNGREEYIKYNKYNNMVWMRWYNDLFDKKSENAIITEYEYKYDSHGNWIELRQRRNGVYNMRIRRDIVYK